MKFGVQTSLHSVLITVPPEDPESLELIRRLKQTTPGALHHVRALLVYH